MVQRNPEDIERPFAERPMRRLVTMVGRALLLRCPNCGSRGLLKHCLRMNERCPACGLLVEREGNDYLSGSVMFNLVLAELIFAFVLVVYLLIAWPDVNWDMLEIAAPLGMAVAPFVLFPFSKLLWLAVDLALRPAHASELRAGTLPKGSPSA
jgi:uncharacterized protein (DUF983 family)